MSDHETQLLKSAQSGGISAFEELTAPHWTIVYNFLLNECADKFVASQLTQDVFVRVFESVVSGMVTGNFHAYIYRTAAEVSRRAVRKSKKIS